MKRTTIVMAIFISFAFAAAAISAETNDDADEHVKVLGEIVSVDLDNDRIGIKNVKIAPHEAAASEYEGDVPDQMLVMIDEDTRLTDDGRNTVLGDFDVGELVHVTYVKDEKGNRAVCSVANVARR
jgi:hypothetical protein